VSNCFPEVLRGFRDLEKTIIMGNLLSHDNLRAHACKHRNFLLVHKTIRNRLCFFLTTALDHNELEKIVMRISNFSKTGWTKSEPNTKKKIIEPLLKILGWDAGGNEVQLEYSIEMASGTSQVDYALMLENKPVVFVEAKAFDTALTPRHARQAISYGKVDDTRWVVLTNGKMLKVLDTKQGKTENECLVVKIDLTKLPMQAKELNMISKDSIFSGGIAQAVKRLEATRKAMRNLEQKQKRIAQEFGKTLLKITGKEVENRIENVSFQLAAQAIQLFEKQSQIVPKKTIEKDMKLVARKQLEAKPSGKVIICPSKIAGVEFLKKYNAWGFVNIREENVPYFALYVGRPNSSISYFGEVDSITKPLESKDDLAKIKEEDKETFEPGKRVIHLKPGTLVKFTDPIPLKNKRFVPKSRLYTTLKDLIQANQVENLWEKVTLEHHLEKIKNTKMKKIAAELRGEILKISEDIGERITKSRILFRTTINFAGIYTQPRGFWFLVRVPGAEFDLPELDSRPQRNPNWTDIRVDEKTNLNLLIEAANLAYRRTK